MNALPPWRDQGSTASLEGYPMPAFSRFAAMLAAATLGLVLAGDASAKTKSAKPRPQAPEQTAQPPSAPPQQFFAAKGVEPLTPELEQSLKPKDSFKECDICPEMVVVPKGSFMMGTRADEPYRLKGEDPAHKVTIARLFAVGRFSITFDEWDACLADGGCNGYKGSGGYGRGRMPADGIDFEQAKSYIAWLSRKVGRTYRLPSESEREYFARAGTTTPFWFGKTISAQNANYDATNNYPGGPYGEASKGPKVVDSYEGILTRRSGKRAPGSAIQLSGACASRFVFAARPA
jgi:formylglycine-generating enzyme required for sulfatase activity